MSDSDYEISPGANPLLDLLHPALARSGDRRWQWAKNNPELGNGIADALGKAMMGIRSSGPMVVPRGMTPKGPYEMQGIGGGPAVNGLRPGIANAEILGSQPGMRGTERNPYPDKMNQYLDWGKPGDNPARLLYEGNMEPANQNHLLTSPPPNNPGLLERMAAEIKAQAERDAGMRPNTNGELTKPDAYRVNRALNNEGEPTPSIRLDLPEGVTNSGQWAEYMARLLMRDWKPPEGPVSPEVNAFAKQLQEDVAGRAADRMSPAPQRGLTVIEGGLPPSTWADLLKSQTPLPPKKD